MADTDFKADAQKSSALLMYEAAHWLGFSPTNGWPEEFQSGQLAVLLNGGRRPSADVRIRSRMIADAVQAGLLEARVEQPDPVIRLRDAGQLTERQAFAKALFPESDGVHTRLVYSEKYTPSPRYYINRQSCAKWLRAIEDSPNKYSRAWLGALWREDECKLNTSSLAWALQTERPDVEAGSNLAGLTLPGIPSHEIIDGFKLTGKDWGDYLSRVNAAAKAYKSALVQKGGRGRGTHTWNPARFALCLLEQRERTQPAALWTVISRHWPDWLPEFESLLEENGNF